jgi:CheY-like chemotaxis protein
MPKDQLLVLVVDDFDDNRSMYAEYLAASGYRVEEASDGAGAIEKAFACRPDIIVMDLSLPVLDGWEATRRIRADERTRATPIIALTGHTFGERGSRDLRETGCDAVLTKPCLPDRLVATIEQLLAPRAGETELHGKRTNHDVD